MTCMPALSRLPECTLPDLLDWRDGKPTLRQPGSGASGGKQPGNLGYNGPDGTAVYWFEDRRAGLPGGLAGTPAQAIVNHPAADTCLAGQHRAWAAMCAAGNSLLVDHWLQEPWWAADLQEVGQACTAAVIYIHVDCGLEELERREASRGDRVLGTARWSKEHCTSLRHGGVWGLQLDSGSMSTEQMVAAVEAELVQRSLIPVIP